MHSQNLFSEKNISLRISLKILPRMLGVNKSVAVSEIFS